MISGSKRVADALAEWNCGAPNKLVCGTGGRSPVVFVARWTSGVFPGSGPCSKNHWNTSHQGQLTVVFWNGGIWIRRVGRASLPCYWWEKIASKHGQMVPMWRWAYCWFGKWEASIAKPFIWLHLSNMFQDVSGYFEVTGRQNVGNTQRMWSLCVQFLIIQKHWHLRHSSSDSTDEDMF